MVNYIDMGDLTKKTTKRELGGYGGALKRKENYDFRHSEGSVTASCSIATGTASEVWQPVLLPSPALTSASGIPV